MAYEDEGVTDLRQVAYVLATPMIETGGSFIPIVESLNYSTDALVAKFGKRIGAAGIAMLNEVTKSSLAAST